MLNKQINTELLKTGNGVVRLCNDELTESYSIGLRTNGSVEWKFISKELHDLLIKELGRQEGKY